MSAQKHVYEQRQVFSNVFCNFYSILVIHVWSTGGLNIYSQTCHTCYGIWTHFHKEFEEESLS